MILRVSARALELENGCFLAISTIFQSPSRDLIHQAIFMFFLPSLNKPVLGHLISDSSFLYQKLTDFDIG